ncbi:MAG TPA: sigma-70 family RNA polymerase sigma factor [Herpetosiphonaceae bacterium]
MDEHDDLAECFEAHRTMLQAVAYRMLGSLSEAEDAVQEAWFRLSRSGDAGIENLGGWLTMVVARVCLDMLRARTSRREEPLDQQGHDTLVSREVGSDPEQEALLADAVGLALLVVLNTLAPAERLAFVLHDIFAVPFDQIASVVGRSPDATRKLASRARRRVRGAAVVPDAELAHQRAVVDAFLTASRTGDFDALLAVLDPDVVLTDDRSGMVREVQGAATIAGQSAGRAKAAQAALVDGNVGVVVAPYGRLMLVLQLTITDARIVRIDVVSDPERLRRLRVAVLDS